MQKQSTKQLVIWNKGLISGMNQSTNPAIVADNEANFLKNIVTDTLGCWSTRKGSLKIGASIASDEGWGLFNYNKTNGTHRLLAITDRDLWLYTEATATWATIDTDEWPIDTRVSGINFRNRFYFGSADGDTALKYTAGGAVTAVVPTIGGNKLGLVKSVLAVGGNSIKPNVVFYTDPFTHNFFSATDTASASTSGTSLVATTAGTFVPDMIGAIVYNTTDGAMVMITKYTDDTHVTVDASMSNDWDNDTIYILQNNFKLDQACTGIVGYQENFIMFDEDKMYKFDPLSNQSQDIGSYGCVNHRTIRIVNGYLIWVNRQGVWLWNGTDMPQDITPKIRDKVNGYGIWDLVDPANFGMMCAGVKESEGKYYLSVGTLTIKIGALATGLRNVVLEFDVKKNAWAVRTYPDEIWDFATFINSTGSKDLYAIYKEEDGDPGAWVVMLDTGTTDAGSLGGTDTIPFQINTQYYTLGSPLVARKVEKYHFKYLSAGDVTVKVSINRVAPVTLRTLEASTTITTEFGWPLANQEGIEHGLQFTGNGQFVLEGFGFQVREDTTLRKVAT
jgi:hypothetical protein